MILDLPELIARLKRHQVPATVMGKTALRAAVAIVLTEQAGEPHMLMIRRAKRPGDPWSGHMGFPGGRRDETDSCDLACAVRETQEELGLDLSVHTPICQLGLVNTGWRPDRPEILVQPYVFHLDDPPPFSPNAEVDGTVWIPVSFLANDDNREIHLWEWKGTSVESDSYRWGQDRVWGLSLMMIDEMIETIRRPLLNA